jgi:hypothetical protein
MGVDFMKNLVMKNPVRRHRGDNDQETASTTPSKFIPGRLPCRLMVVPPQGAGTVMKVIGSSMQAFLNRTNPAFLAIEPCQAGRLFLHFSVSLTFSNLGVVVPKGYTFRLELHLK